jgi:hypothetical protein
MPVDPRHAYDQTATDLGLPPAAYDQAYVDQLQFLNRHALELVDSIVSASQGDTVIIVMSDHGYRDWSANEDDLPADEITSRFSSLFASRTPEHPHLFGDTPSTVNVLRRLLSAYLGLNLPDLAYEAWLPIRGNLERVHD